MSDGSGWGGTDLQSHTDEGVHHCLQAQAWADPREEGDGPSDGPVDTCGVVQLFCPPHPPGLSMGSMGSPLSMSNDGTASFAGCAGLITARPCECLRSWSMPWGT